MNLVTRYDKQIQRGLEIFTGGVPWFLILFPVWGSLIFPKAVAYFVLIFEIYWLYRSLTIAVFAFAGYLNIKAAQKTDWASLSPEDIHHILIIPNYKEKEEKLRTTLDALAKQTLPKKQLTVVLAMEEREDEAKEKARKLTEEFAPRLPNFWSTFHPLAKGEVVGKSSNEAFAGKEIKKKLVDEMGLNMEKITITTCDADAIFPPDYFACLGEKFSRSEKRHRRIWQSPIFPYNNIERVPAPIRVMSILGSIIFLANIQRTSRSAFNYSTYSASLKMYDEIGFWDTDVIPEDWHMFLKSFFHLRGEVEVEPIHLPIFIDAAESVTLKKTLINRYEQCKREAWGATDIPYALKEFFHHPEIATGKKLFRLVRLLESHFLWSANWFIITLGATIPTLLNPRFSQTVLGHNLSQISQTVLTVCLLGLLSVIAIDKLLRPGGGGRAKRWLNIPSYLQWFLLPLSSLFLSALPGLDAHTRLLLGKRLEYRVTEKV